MELETLKNSVTIFLDSVPTEEQCDMLYRLSRSIDKFIELNNLLNEFNTLHAGFVQYLSLEDAIQNDIKAIAYEIKRTKEYFEQCKNEEENA